jgi:hypothetical protein
MLPEVNEAVEIERTPAIEWMSAKFAERMHQMMVKLRAKDQIIADLLQTAGSRGVCRGLRCRAEIILVFHRATGELTPYNTDGTRHYTACPDAEQFNKRRKETTNA